MIVFVYGTTAEAIKLAPLAKSLTELGVPYEQWLTMFHGDSLLESVRRLGFGEPDVIIPNGNDGKTVRSSYKTFSWLMAISWWIVKNRKKLRKRLGNDSLIIVHGDTLTTVMGTVYARMLKITSAHVEAGLRSGNWRHPFPEELDRQIAGQLATIHYVPSEEAVKNLAGKKNVVYTHGNTVIDSVLDVSKQKVRSQEKFGVCLLHRFEFLGNKELVKETLRTLSSQSAVPLRMYLDDYSGSLLEEELSQITSSTLIPQRKLPYDQFISELQGAEFVITDSGGIQAECALLGLPTLIHRKATEQNEGVGQNILLSNWDMEVVVQFLENYDSYRKKASIPAISPTQVILDDLATRGYLSVPQR